MDGEPLLHRRFPVLADSLPFVRLGTAPTPVTEVDGVWVKDEGAYGDGGWGGNKVRKLEWLLPDAKRRGRSTVLTFGALGTNHGLATALYARDLGLEAAVVVVDQPLDDHVRRQFARLQESGAAVHRTRTKARTAAALPWLLLKHRNPYVFPAGGSSPVGVLGAVEVGLEIAAQVSDGAIPEPARVVTAVGTGGTAAGVGLGLALAGLPTRVHAVVVNDTLRLDHAQMTRLAARTVALLRRRGADVPEASPALDVDRSQLGPGYGVPTDASAGAIGSLAAQGVQLDPVYTGKAMAAVLADERPGPVLFLRTHGPR